MKSLDRYKDDILSIFYENSIFLLLYLSKCVLNLLLSAHLTEKAVEKTFVKTKRKFNCLMDPHRTTQWKRRNNVDQTRWVVNLSSQELSNTEEVLRRGLNFAPAPRRIPYVDMTAGMESAAN